MLKLLIVTSSVFLALQSFMGDLYVAHVYIHRRK
jgi:hypothetical protein